MECWNKYKYFIFLFILTALFAGCKNDNKSSSVSKDKSVYKIPEPNDEFYQEIGQEIGLDFVHSIGSDDMKNIVESVGGGAAFFDYDQDGYIDLYTCSGTWVEGFSKSEKPKKL